MLTLLCKCNCHWNSRQNINWNVTRWPLTGERSYFANKLKATGRLKAKLLLIARELRVSDTKMINKQAIVDKWNRETRRYTFGPQKCVDDLSSGTQLSDLNSVLEGDIEPFIRGRIISRQWWTTRFEELIELFSFVILYAFFFYVTDHTTSKLTPPPLCKMYHSPSQTAIYWSKFFPATDSSSSISDAINQLLAMPSTNSRVWSVTNSCWVFIPILDDPKAGNRAGWGQADQVKHKESNIG
jgi:hypothetical protein